MLSEGIQGVPAKKGGGKKKGKGVTECPSMSFHQMVINASEELVTKFEGKTITKSQSGSIVLATSNSRSI